ncbi:MAG: transcription termination factor NusA [Oscillospiraceae bacterium]|nr:transcription termination factor NusA [Oscillospiraceae bacterium]
MATRKKKKNEKTEEDYGREFFEALNQIETEKGIKKEYMIEKITQALIAAYKKDHKGVGDNLVVTCNEETGRIRMVLHRDVVETVDNPNTEISLEDARKALPGVSLGDVVSSEIKTRNFGRIAAQAARQVIIQGIREAERGMVYDKFSSKSQEIVTGVVQRVDANGGMVVQIGNGTDATEAYLSMNEQVAGESYQVGDVLKVYVVDVRRSNKGPQILISRTHSGLVKRLFELEVPEIFEGIVEVKSIAREAGSRTKMAVSSDDPNVDPIGACVGNRGARVNAIVSELRGEKVDIVKYSEAPEEFVAAALAPANVVSVTVLPEGKSCRVVVPDDQLSLAIGKEGQNARLAAKLTGYRIDIKPKSVADLEPVEAEAPAGTAEEALLADEPEEEELLAD